MARIGLYKQWLEEDKLILLEGWARSGLSDKQIAANIGIEVGTYYKWQKKYSQFKQAIKKGKEVADFEVENALFKSALGYEVEEVKTYIEDSANGKKKRVEKTVKHIKPDVTAQIFWLKNRNPEYWHDERKVKHGGIEGSPIEIESKTDLSRLSDEELTALESILAKSADD